MATKRRVVHYLNQFFAGIGGEDKAGAAPRARDGAVGPGGALQRALGDAAEIVGTVYCGDNFFSEQEGAAAAAVVELIRGYRPDLVVAGPAFNAGRYAVACGMVCQAVEEQLRVPTVTGMHPDNPAVELCRQRVYIVPSGPTATSMAPALQAMAALGLKRARGERLGLPEDDGYLARGLRFTEVATTTAATRAVEMLLASVRGEACRTEWPLPRYERVAPPLPLKDVRRATIALVTSGGIVPRGNPDRIESTYATKWARYSLVGVNDLTPEGWQSIHGGYDTTRANEDPDRVLPVDVLRELEAEGAIGRLHDDYWVFVGSGASTTSARRFAEEMARELRASAVEGVVFTAT
jgi:glycine reductase complex component B subunit gamma